MFNKLKSKLKPKENKGTILGAPMKGQVIPVTEVNDPAFSEELLGKGIAVKPTNGRVVAPIDSEIVIMFETGHAVSLKTADGAEILIHVGLDTVNLKGEHFKSFVKAGDNVKKGDLLIECDIEKIKAAGYDTICPMVVCNSMEFDKINQKSNGQVNELDEVLEIIK
ncbi:MAG: PTS glucose transporter subunit IIA [Terrisporobacter sp.]|uniref:PTS sugar transporter subunit IIA n=1 Tax=Terrisporobacter sp. TaxID=1965305 RepID=UPI002FC9BC70